MTLTTRLLAARKGATLGSAALALAMLGSNGAWAQCTDNFNYVGAIGGGGFVPIAQFLPLGRGSSLSALTSTINTVNTAFLTSTTAFVSAPGAPQPDQQGGGVWGRVIAGTADTSTNSTATLDVSRVTPAIPPATGTQSCNTKTRQDYWGYQVGHDFSILNGGGTGANLHWGVTAGYLEARTKDITPAGSFFQPNSGITFATPAGTFREESQVPFVGLYTAFTKGNFALDAQARVDFYQSTLSDSLNGLSGQRLDAQGFSLTGNAAYNIPLGSGWFIEPSGGVVWSRVEIDPLNVSGIPTPTNVISRGTVTIDDIESVLGRASFSVGKTITGGRIVWQPYFTASVFHEFKGDVTARSLLTGTNNPNIDGFQLTMHSSGGIGTYGQFALGTAAVIANTGWLGYGRLDYRTGDNIDGWSVNAGLRYQFTPERRGSVKDGQVPAVFSHNWSGAYIGAYAGTTWGDEHWHFVGSGARVIPDFAGAIGGGQVGYNVQVGQTVYGVEAEYGLSNARGGVSCPNLFFYTCEADVNQLAMLTGRFGVTWGRALFYAKGGLAAGEVEAGTHLNPGTTVVPNGPGPVLLALAPAATTSDWQIGWTVGAGMEFALTDRWSAKAEYMHYDLGNDTFRTFVGDPGTRVDIQGNTVRIGVNYHFGPRCCEAPLK
jgi:opacity protein-like surface antigen